MPVKLEHNRHDLDHIPNLEGEIKILWEKFLELEAAVEEYQETVDEHEEEEDLTSAVGKRLISNSEELLETAKERVKEAKNSKNIADIRFTMGWIDGCVEIITKPFLPD